MWRNLLKESNLPHFKRVLYCYQSSLDEMFSRVVKGRYQGKNGKNERVYNCKNDVAYVLWGHERDKPDQIVLKNKKTGIERVYVSREIAMSQE